MAIKVGEMPPDVLFSARRMTMMQNLETPTETTSPKISEWKEIVSRFQEPSTGRATWQIVNTLVPYALLWYAMYRAVAVSWWLALPLAVVAGLLLVRVFIIFHDCGHGSYFRSRRVNDIVGFLSGMLTFTPVHRIMWRTGSMSDFAHPFCVRNSFANVPLLDTWTAVYFAPVPSLSPVTFR